MSKFYTFASILIIFCFLGTSCREEQLEISVSDITISSSNLSMTVGDTESLIATISPNNATNKKVIWSSSEATVASVKNGLVTAVKAGTAIITAKSDDGGKTDTCQVTVMDKTYPVESISLDKSELSMVVGDEAILKVTVSPENATNKNIEWSSTDPNVASVKDGNVTAIKIGKASITAKSEDGEKVATCQVSVTDKIYPVESISLDKSELSMVAGDEVILKVTISPENATNKNIEWSSTDSSVASVKDGDVTAMKAGSATITAKSADGGKIATCHVLVTEKIYPVESISLDKSELFMVLGDEVTLIATISPEKATNKNIEWSSTDLNVASVKDGKVTAVKEGTATITAKSEDGGKAAVCQVVVTGVPLTFTSTGNSSVAIRKEGNPNNIVLESRIGSSDWEPYTIGKVIALKQGESLQFRAGKGGNESFSKGLSDYYLFSASGDNMAASGNIISLLDRTLQKTYISEYCFARFFSYCTRITTAPVLPATILAKACYFRMFQGCTNLATAPALPATTLAIQCYTGMFYGCTSLKTAPALPATTVVESCYGNMFYGCTNLVTTPALPATTLAHNCYNGMFYGCTSLTTAPELPATKLSDGCYYNMFFGCTNLVTTPELPATTLASYCYSGMFQNCTSLTTAPELPASTLTELCYQNMFSGCLNLNYIKMLATDISAQNCLSNWVSGVASSGTFVKNIAATWNDTGVNGVPRGWVIKFEGEAPENPSLPLTFTSTGSTIIALQKVGSPNDIVLEYKKGQDGWTLWDGCIFSLDDRETLQFRAGERGNDSFSKGIDDFYHFVFGGDGTIAVSGNIMSLLDRTLQRSSVSTGCFAKLFSDCTSMTTAPVLPATTLADRCYCGMFRGCTCLKIAPQLPSTTLASYCYYCMFSGCTTLTKTPAILPSTTLAVGCYQYMFKGCTNLSTAPTLPATTLAIQCYCGMFDDCASLSTAPELPATTLADYCYGNMFDGCSSLVTAPELPATTLVESCYRSMFFRCTSLTTAPTLPATTLASHCYYDMFYDCTSLSTAPELSATSLAMMCYCSMFYGCTSLTTAPELPATTLADNCYQSMFSGCTSLTTVPELPATTLVEYCYCRMFSGCSRLNYIKMMATDISAKSCVSSWVSGVANSGTFVKSIDATWSNSGVIPSGWTVKIVTE